MTFEQIRVLHAVVAAGSIRGGAKRVNKTAPSISTTIRTLENEIGIELFSRDGYRTQLTEAGIVFYEKSKVVLKHMVELQEICQRLSTDEETLVRISINAVFPLKIVLRKLAAIERKYTNTQINVSTESMGGAVERLKDNGTDIIISTLTDIDESNIHCHFLTSVKIIPTAHKNHPLAQKTGVITTEQAQKHTQVIVSDSSMHSKKQSLDVISGGRHCVVTDFSAKKDILLAGLGWGGLPEHVISRELNKGTLIPLNVEGYDIRESNQYLMRRVDHPLGVVGQEIWKALASLDEC